LYSKSGSGLSETGGMLNDGGGSSLDVGGIIVVGSSLVQLIITKMISNK
jgi:hypothetical protein